MMVETVSGYRKMGHFRVLLILLFLAATAGLGVLSGCGDSTAGPAGQDGTSCTVADNGDGASTLSCTDGTSVLITDGQDGTEGPEGPTGAQGAEGPEGPTGPAGAGISTKESCLVCHGAGKVADVAAIHPDPLIKPVVSNISVSVDVSGNIDAAFHVEAGGAPLTTLTFDDVRAYLADIVPAGTATLNTPLSTWDSSYLERWAYERSSTAGAAFDDSDADNGNYVFKFFTTTADVTTLAPEGNLATHTQRVLLRVDGGDYGFDRTVGLLDFMMPAAGSSTAGLANLSRVVVDASACTACHGDPLQEAAHGGGYQTPQACNICHSPIGVTYGDEMQADEAWLASLVHKIHAAIDMPAFPDRINGGGYANVTFPQNVKDCEICHADKGQDLADAWKTNPTAQVCGTCHTSVNFTTGEGHQGGAQSNNAACAGCHPAAAVANYHKVVPAASDTPEFDVAISMTAPANGSYYVAGETPMVTVTLQNHSDGTAVDPGVYTTAQDAKGVSGGGLSGANLYVYGPRAKAVPVLTTNSSTDPALAEGATPTQGHPLFVGGTDALVSSDSGGFKYQLMAIPEGMAAGAYMVRFEGADYGGVSSTDYVTSSSAVINFQVGTATEELKVAGDGCLRCHGDTRMHLTGSHAHNAPFDTDACLGCHDQSGNHAIPIANRVHAVHSANSDGDLYTIEGSSRDWSEVTFPQDTSTCVTCHNSGDETYKTHPFMMPCAGCHVEDDNGVLDHMRQNGGPF